MFIGKFTIVNILELLAKANEKTFKAKYFLKFDQCFRNFATGSFVV